MTKTAIILLNLGGPDTQQAVQPFLFNLFKDPDIIRIPQPFRTIIAKFISTRRAPIARDIYAKLGGGSPILKNTQQQSQALEKLLNTSSESRTPNSEPLFKTFIAMRYWHPFALETAREVKSFDPDQIILLPLYPQFSTTTTASSIKDWNRSAKKISLTVPTKTICCYPQDSGFIKSLAAATRRGYEEAKTHGMPRILFSAHGLPEKIVKAGDPYQAQCELTAAALRRELNIENLDSVLCFQSRVGPLKWISPSTDDEVRRAGQDKTPLVVVPIAFVSDHSETLVEIDIEYRLLAEQFGVPFFAYVPAVGTAPDFIHSLAKITRTAATQKTDCLSAIGARLCPKEFSGCICAIE